MDKLNRHLVAAVGASVFVIAACSGGGDDNDVNPVDAGGSGDTGANPFVPFVGNWSSGCVDTTFVSPAGGTSSAGTSSEIVTATLDKLSGADKASVSIDDKKYSGSRTCEPAMLSQSGSATGQVTAQTATKAISGDPDHLKTGTAQTASFRLDSVTLHKVTLNFAPAIGATTKVGYMLEGGKLYGVGGTRQADGLGWRFANISLTKQ
jgi:hypothetical protein